MRIRLFAALLALVLLCGALCAVSFAEGGDDDAQSGTATNVAADADKKTWGNYDWSSMTDGIETTYVDVGYGESVEITSATPVCGIYIKFHVKSSAWTVTANGKTLECGQNGFIHEYVDLAAEAGAATELTISFPRGAAVAELELYTEGTLPDSVQKWELPLEGGADLVLFSTHADDEQLFFAGVLPYAVAKGARCQVVYFCDHSGEPRRIHEQLNGLWALGVRYYPVLGTFPDLYSESYEQALAAYAAAGYDNDDFIEWQVENIRRFRPQVLVIHDDAGEYGHGSHIINSKTARDAVDLAADMTEYPLSLATYGTWETPKVYMHLFAENEIVLDYDEPLEHFGGRTAYQMACVGFAEHKSQHWTWFYEWLYGIDHEQAAKGEDAGRFTSATQIKDYNPAHYGLWRTTVGEDTKNDMFENVVLYTRPGDEPRPAEDDTQTESETAAEPDSFVAPAVTERVGEDENPERDRMIKIVAICAGVVVLGTVIALIASGARSRAEKKRKERANERRASVSEERSRRLREARDERAQRDQLENTAEIKRIITESGGGASGARPARDPYGKGAEREAAIRAARAARESGAASHDKPTDKRY